MLSRGGNFGGFSLRLTPDCCVWLRSCSVRAADIAAALASWPWVTQPRTARTTRTSSSLTVGIFIWYRNSRPILDVNRTLNCLKWEYKRPLKSADLLINSLEASQLNVHMNSIDVIWLYSQRVECVRAFNWLITISLYGKKWTTIWKAKRLKNCYVNRERHYTKKMARMVRSNKLFYSRNFSSSAKGGNRE